MRIPNWVVALAYIVLCVNMINVVWIDYKRNIIWWTTAELICALIWFLLAAYTTWRAIRHPNGTYGRLWNKK